ncbi:MAG: hypothetical protein ACT4P8_20320 [Betaproteobacteria bacterium]
MEWLSQNWIWLIVIIGVVGLLTRGRHGGMMGCCGTHGHQGPVDKAAKGDPVGSKENTTAAPGAGPASHSSHGGRC